MSRKNHSTTPAMKPEYPGDGIMGCDTYTQRSLTDLSGILEKSVLDAKVKLGLLSSRIKGPEPSCEGGRGDPFCDGVMPTLERAEEAMLAVHGMLDHLVAMVGNAKS